MNNKISFCTTVMNRLDHLKITLPKNINDNINYTEVEFVVLNYNSKDLIDLWIYENMYEYIESGVLKYYKVDEYELYHRSHSRNLAMKCASGTILCNVDADNFLGKGYAYYLNEIFQSNKNVFITVDEDKVRFDLYGRISFTKDDFSLINGYDEKMFGYGYEDKDIRARLINLGREPIFSQNPNHLAAIEHSNSDRIENEYKSISDTRVFIAFINQYSSIIVHLMDGHRCQYAEILNHRIRNASNFIESFSKRPLYDISLVDNMIHIGIWESVENHFKITYDFDGRKKNIIISKKSGWHFKLATNDKTINCNEIKEKTKVSEVIRFFSEIRNRIIMQNNIDNQITAANNGSYGKGKVQLNFNTTSEII